MACVVRSAAGHRAAQASLIACSVIALALGVLVYLADRPAGSAALLPWAGIHSASALLGGSLHQLGRSAAFCGPAWNTVSGQSLQRDRIALLARTPCADTERCPDFTAGGAPLRFGFATWVRTASASAAGTLELGIDNWKVTVWRNPGRVRAVTLPIPLPV